MLLRYFSAPSLSTPALEGHSSIQLNVYSVSSTTNCFDHAHLTSKLTYFLVAKYYGVPTANASNIIFFPAATGRNIGAGINVLLLTLLGERKALGIFCLCWTWAGIADTKVLNDHPDGRDQAMHIRNIFGLLALGPLLIYSSTA